MTIQISHQTRSLVAPFNPAIAQLFPHAKRFTFKNQDLIVVPHGHDETRMLRNLGMDVPAPIVEHYSFPSADHRKPFGKQILTTASMTMNARSYVLNDMGTGKTAAAIWAHDFLQTSGLAHRMLIVAPLSTLDFTWRKEIMRMMPHKRVIVLTGTAKRRKEKLAEHADIYIVNHDGVKVLHNELMQRLDIDVICFDEAAAYRNGRAERSKLARKLTLRRKFIWAMTGSPTPTAPTDAFGLAWLVTPDTAPRSYVQFRQETMLNVSQFRWVPRKDAAETVANLLQPSVRFSLDEIIELPPVIERTIQVPMGERQQKVYDTLKEHAAAQLREGSITAANGGILFSKLLQTSLGWTYGESGKTYEFDNGARIQALMDVIDSADRKVIVFSPFKSATMGISKALKKDGYDYAEVTGDTPHGERTRIFNAFQGSSEYRVLNAHPECMSHGLTLTAADTVIWFGPTTRLETYEQANARITRIGQTHKQQIVRLVSSPAERITYRRLQDRHALQENILSILADITNGDQ